MTSRQALPLAVALVAAAALVVVLVGQAGGQRTDTGLVVDVDSAGLTDVRGFTLRTDDGRETTYRIGRLENGTDFPPGHLVEHLATAERVRVFYREESGERVAFRLEDAPGP